MPTRKPGCCHAACCGRPFSPLDVAATYASFQSLRHADRPICLWLAIPLEVEDVGADLSAAVEVDFCGDHFVPRRRSARDDLACRRRYDAARDQVTPFFASPLCDANRPKSVLVTTSLQGQVVMKILAGEPVKRPVIFCMHIEIPLRLEIRNPRTSKHWLIGPSESFFGESSSV